jgi:hypothetical protein
MTSEDPVQRHLRWALETSTHSTIAAVNSLTNAVVALVYQVGAITEQLTLLNEKLVQ